MAADLRADGSAQARRREPVQYPRQRCERQRD